MPMWRVNLMAKISAQSPPFERNVVKCLPRKDRERRGLKFFIRLKTIPVSTRVGRDGNRLSSTVYGYTFLLATPHR